MIMGRHRSPNLHEIRYSTGEFADDSNDDRCVVVVVVMLLLPRQCYRPASVCRGLRASCRDAEKITRHAYLL
jgi:hypothetical protein